ncbi:uncharacterized protein BCR38DRAFT_2642 [Pseudomassariella vexata]|uniref:Uncharacterized protein n=1 Tax=Pseudomassariella vexata TaxID=1141098 RepID=A0A1Y2EHJ1_9PEZI|nr:uncharacterized protein BCR38DRAFT_2642 [Pseudomassariella vexata]ORY71029.1 hypothetical protein BCR38DRAFT_2642 [Pseudomassariella vexata]
MVWKPRRERQKSVRNFVSDSSVMFSPVSTSAYIGCLQSFVWSRLDPRMFGILFSCIPNPFSQPNSHFPTGSCEHCASCAAGSYTPSSSDIKYDHNEDTNDEVAPWNAEYLLLLVLKHNDVATVHELRGEAPGLLSWRILGESCGHVACYDASAASTNTQ